MGKRATDNRDPLATWLDYVGSNAEGGRYLVDADSGAVTLQRRRLPGGRGAGPRGLLTRGVVALCVLAALPFGELRGQTFEGDTWTTVGGAALGLYSGGMLGLVGTMMPCNRTLQGDRCTASGVGTGAAMGMVMGGLIGAQNTDALDIRVENAAIGVLAGAVVGVGLRRAVRQYGWADVGAAALVGGAFGAAPRGSLIGLGAGTVTGAVAWWLVPDSGIADFVMLSLVGAAVGGMVDWTEGAASAKRDRPPQSFPVVSIRVR